MPLTDMPLDELVGYRGPSACQIVSPDFIIAMPVTMPQAKMPGMVATLALNPSRKASRSLSAAVARKASAFVLSIIEKDARSSEAAAECVIDKRGQFLFARRRRHE